MTPKEKAQEIFDKMKGSRVKQTHSKRCAIIAVDEILKNFVGLHKPEYTAFDCIGEHKYTFERETETHMNGYEMEEYWEEVKRGIQSL